AGGRSAARRHRGGAAAAPGTPPADPGAAGRPRRRARAAGLRQPADEGQEEGDGRTRETQGVVTPMSSAASMQERAHQFRQAYAKVQSEIGKVIVGHTDIVHGVLTCLFVGGHALLEGVPGLGKTMLIRTLSTVLDLEFNRIQFTPDLMPSDIIGTNIISEGTDGRRLFSFQKGPIFA